MRKLFSFLIVFLTFFVSFTSFVSAQEKILEFKSDIKVNSDATIDIVESITYEPPQGVNKHGILWRIPVTYSVFAFRRPTQLNVKEVKYYPVSNPESVTRDRYSRSSENGWTILKIGDPSRYIDGTQIYTIDYTLKYSGILYEEDHDEVYLNIIGPGWDMPIENASATLSFPEEILEVICFSGEDESVEQNCDTDYEGNVLNVKPKDTLAPFEGYTVAVKLPVGSIENTTGEQVFKVLLANIGILLPIPVGIYLFGFALKKYKNRKLTIKAQFNPTEDMDCLSSSILLKNSYNTKNISALLIELAQRGYYKIKEYKKNKYELIKLEKDINELPQHLKILPEAIFAYGETVPLSKLTNFYSTASRAYTQSVTYLDENEYFSKARKNKRALFFVLSIVGGIFLIPTLMFFILLSSVGTYLGLLLSLLLLLIFAIKMDTKTEKGNQLYHFLLGLRLYIDTAEKHRIKFHNDPRKYREIFERLLPYAMIFGLEKKWAKQFENVYTTPPSWYEGDFTTFNTLLLANSLSSFNRNISVSSRPPSSSYSSSGGHRSGGWSSGSSGFGGGGFSGGGGGGSGGSSW